MSSRIADATKRPEKVLNVHFFNPALVMKLVEVVKGPHVADETVETVFAVSRRLGKTPVLIKKGDLRLCRQPHLQRPDQEACYLLDQDVASIEDIDLAVKTAWDIPWDPLNCWT